VIRQRDLERRVHRFGTGVGVEHVAELVVGVLHQLLGQVERSRVAHLEGGRKIELAYHLAHGGHDLRLRMAAGHAPQAGRAVQDGVAVHVLVVHAFGRHQQARIGLEIAVVRKRHPERRHGCWSGLVHAFLLNFLQTVKIFTSWQNHGAIIVSSFTMAQIHNQQNQPTVQVT
jgi:hypothetical protein